MYTDFCPNYGDSLSDQTFVIKHHQTNLTYGG